MASIEFIQKRIAGKEREIERLEKKLDRIKAAQATNWEKNPYYYNESDLISAEKELHAAQVSLTNYENQLDAELEKSNSRNIPAILNFLTTWKASVMQHYKQAFETYLVELKEWHEFNSDHVEWMNSDGWKLRKEDKDEYNRICSEYRLRMDEFRHKWSFLSGLVNYKTVDGNRTVYFEEEKFQKILDQDADAKYDFIIARTNAIVGEIIDASNLSVGDKGDLNGIIIGSKGKAKVQTIGAGGYNIQCYHFRTLIHSAN